MHSKKSVRIAKRNRSRVKQEFWADVQADRSILLSLDRRHIAIYVRPSLADIFLKIMDGDETEHPEIALRKVDELPVEGNGYILFINDTLLMFKHKEMRRLRTFCKRKLLGP